ncbi:hypothetical protein BJV82DRAFT_181906 [Fennellomyces sp. T-0311]|nr:hypothetical protein BJV82DRAFT_181906 [Fennellomyces sp. T-0311]
MKAHIIRREKRISDGWHKHAGGACRLHIKLSPLLHIFNRLVVSRGKKRVLNLCTHACKPPGDSCFTEYRAPKKALNNLLTIQYMNDGKRQDVQGMKVRHPRRRPRSNCCNLRDCIYIYTIACSFRPKKHDCVFSFAQICANGVRSKVYLRKAYVPLSTWCQLPSPPTNPS